MSATVGQPAPRTRTAPAVWAKENLFSSRWNGALSVAFGVAVLWAVYRLARLVFVTGRWEIVRRNLTNFMVGGFPRGAVWRVWVAVFLIAFAVCFQWGVALSRARATRTLREDPTSSFRRAWVAVWPLVLVAAVITVLSPRPITIMLLLALAGSCIAARAFGERLEPLLRRRGWLVPTGALVASFLVLSSFGGVAFGRWQGLLLTVTAAVAGIVLSFPFGVLLALGRRSTLPVLRAVSVAYIELIRGVPLITLLFMASFILGFLLPPGTPIPSIAARGMVAIVLFTSAYLAEVVRGGLQAVPRGQVEAAQALGLRTVTITRMIVLPQALRAVIPAIVGQFISLFKDTSLLGFIGLIELLQVTRQANAQPAFLGQGVEAEALVFVSLLYWAGAYWMSKASQRLERRLGVGER